MHWSHIATAQVHVSADGRFRIEAHEDPTLLQLDDIVQGKMLALDENTSEGLERLKQIAAEQPLPGQLGFDGSVFGAEKGGASRIPPAHLKPTETKERT